LHAKPLLFGPSLTVVDAGAQFGGHVVNYQHNLSFVTVHGSGHMVPLHSFFSFLL
jgi:cathepsin A (carboxypeptidase C)